MTSMEPDLGAPATGGVSSPADLIRDEIGIALRGVGQGAEILISGLIIQSVFLTAGFVVTTLFV